MLGSKEYPLLNLIQRGWELGAETEEERKGGGGVESGRQEESSRMKMEEGLQIPKVWQFAQKIGNSPRVDPHSTGLKPPTL